MTVVIRANTDVQEPVDSMRYPEKYTSRTPKKAPHVFMTPNKAPAQEGARS